jgi:hypothetical protein
MRTISNEAIWEMQHFAQGHTGFANITPVMSGGTIGNYTLTYAIDTGSGYSAFKTLNTTNLTAESISPTTGFRLKIKVVTLSTNTTAITFLKLFTTTTTAAQNAIDYPLDTVPVTITVLDSNTLAAVQNARVRILTTVGSNLVLEGLTNVSGVLSGTTQYASNAITGTVRRATVADGTLYKPGSISGTTTSLGFSTTVLMLSDE